MVNMFPTEYPWEEVRELNSSPAAVLQHLVEQFRKRKYELIDSLPAGTFASNFEGRFYACREIDLTSKKRRNGKIMLSIAIFLTLGIFVMLAEDIWAERGIISTPLLGVVILGGLGLSRLGIPVQKRREVLEVTVQGSGQGQSRVTLRGASSLLSLSKQPSVWSGEIENIPLLDHVNLGTLDD